MRTVRTALTLAVFVLVFLSAWLFFGCAHAELLSYEEQYQLFLFSTDYLLERIAVAGGVADYVAEFLTQFYYVPWAGSAVVSSVLTLMMWLAYMLTGRHEDWRDSLTWCLLSAAAVVLTVALMGDENVLLSYPVAIDMVLAATLAADRLPKMSKALFGVVLAVSFSLLYWCAGAVAVIFALATPLRTQWLHNKGAWAAGSMVMAVAVMMAAGRFLMVQWPVSSVMFGINYYRATDFHPAGIFVVAAWVTAIAVLSKGIKSMRKPVLNTLIMAVTAVALAAGGTILIRSSYDKDKFDALLYDKLVREGRWTDIIAHAENTPPRSEMAVQGLNLALAKTGQMGDRMFCFPQQGIESLVSKHKLDNTTCLVSAEVFFHLGMTNAAFWYNFDLQESIINNRKSGRFMKRMAQCLIVNGKYKAAGKYLNKLRQSLFYRDWAEETMRCIQDEAQVNSHPVYGEMRRNSFKKEMLYNYGEVGKMFGLAAIDSDGRNYLAWDYFCAAMLLQGDLRTFTGMYHYAAETFHMTRIPRHYQEAIALFWTFGHQNFDGLPFPVDNSVKTQIAELARAYGQSRGNIDAWRPAFAQTYWAYFLTRQQQNVGENTEEQHAEREG